MKHGALAAGKGNWNTTSLLTNIKTPEYCETSCGIKEIGLLKYATHGGRNSAQNRERKKGIISEVVEEYIATFHYVNTNVTFYPLP